MSLNPRQQAFVDAYTGNGTAAARAAGYEGDDATLAVTANRLLKNAKVKEALDARRRTAEATAASVTATAGRIATRLERQSFWTEVMLGVGAGMGAEMKDRLKAAELLGKSEGDFIERHQHEVTDSFAALLAEAAKRERGGP